MKKLKLFITILIITFILLLINSINVQAALQANPNTHYKKQDKFNNWMTNFRKMEQTNGTMGLKETLNSDLTASSESNNIDVHMMRTTEYGAIAILSASGYGNPQMLQNSKIKTTTGNKTGVYFGTTTNYNWQDIEFTAGGVARGFSNINKKYYDLYTSSSSSAKSGDALTTCKNWHGANQDYWVGYNAYMTRGGDSKIFNFSGHYGSDENYTYVSRGVAVCGEGL